MKKHEYKQTRDYKLVCKHCGIESTDILNPPTDDTCIMRYTVELSVLSIAAEEHGMMLVPIPELPKHCGPCANKDHECSPGCKKSTCPSYEEYVD